MLKTKNKIKAELRAIEQEGFHLKGKTGVWREVRDGETLPRGAALSMDLETAKKCVRMKKTAITAAVTRPVRESGAALLAELEGAVQLEQQALVAKRRLLDAMMAQDHGDELEALDAQISHLKVRRDVLSENVHKDDDAVVKKFSLSEHDEEISRLAGAPGHTDGWAEMRPSEQTRHGEPSACLNCVVRKSLITWG